MEPYFTKVTCSIKGSNVLSIPDNRIFFYESPWDFQTNEFIKNNKDKINVALKTYPSEYCYYKLEYIPLSSTMKFKDEEEKIKFMEQTAKKQRPMSHDRWGVFYCSLFQDNGPFNPGEQRVLFVNVEDNTPQAILTAIRYLAQFADKMKNEVKDGSGCIPQEYILPWQVDLAVEEKDLYNSAFDWLEGKNELYFNQRIVKYDENSHRLWFVDNHDNIDKEFVAHDLLTQAFYILVWNHPEGVKDYDLCVSPADKDGLKRERELKDEFTKYYIFLKTGKVDIKNPEEFRKKVDNFCEFVNSKARHTARTRIRTAFFEHEKERVKDNELFAKKVADYYGFDATEGKIKVINRIETIYLPEELMSEKLKKYNEEHADHADK